MQNVLEKYFVCDYDTKNIGSFSTVARKKSIMYW